MTSCRLWTELVWIASWDEKEAAREAEMDAAARLGIGAGVCWRGARVGVCCGLKGSTMA